MSTGGWVAFSIITTLSILLLLILSIGLAVSNNEAIDKSKLYTKKVLNDLQIIKKKEYSETSGGAVAVNNIVVGGSSASSRKVFVLKDLYEDKFVEVAVNVDTFYRYEIGDIIHLKKHYHYEKYKGD